jgi:hypothetical protein
VGGGGHHGRHADCGHINGATAGTTAGSYSLPPGGTIAITYTVARAWVWTNPWSWATPGYTAENVGALTGGGTYNPVTALPMARMPSRIRPGSA